MTTQIALQSSQETGKTYFSLFLAFLNSVSENVYELLNNSYICRLEEIAFGLWKHFTHDSFLETSKCRQINSVKILFSMLTWPSGIQNLVCCYMDDKYI